MIDIHSHILPGIDDGATDLDESLAMARMAVKDGIRVMIATPHIAATTTRALIQEKVVELSHALRDAQIPLQIATGGEIPFHFEGAIEEFTLCEGPYLLLELPHGHVPKPACQKITDLHQQGYKVIIAHPERNGAILKNPGLLEELHDSGALVQITAESVTGQLGPQTQHCSHYLLRKKMVHFLATDCHSSLHRKPLLHKAKKVVGKIIGKKEAEKLVTENPNQIIKKSVPFLS